jgi:hypothetical protein
LSDFVFRVVAIEYLLTNLHAAYRGLGSPR